MRKSVWVFILLGIGIAIALGTPRAHGETPAKSAAELEKEKALKNPYPNDFGPGEVKDLSAYNAEQKSGYKLMMNKCAQCHTPSRPLNSQFIDMKEAELAAAKAKQPEMFKDKTIWQIETGIWQRYIKRMMAKPGCNISTEEGKKIWKFIVAYSINEKTGKNMEKWKTSRSQLMKDFKEKHPERYKELFQQ